MKGKVSSEEVRILSYWKIWKIFIREFRVSEILEDIVEFIMKFIKILFRKNIYFRILKGIWRNFTSFMKLLIIFIFTGSKLL